MFFPQNNPGDLQIFFPQYNQGDQCRLDSNPQTPEHKESAALSMDTYHPVEGILAHALTLEYAQNVVDYETAAL